MIGSRGAWLVIALGLAAGGCVVESPDTVESPETAERTQEINLPPTVPPLCFSAPGCSLTFLGGYSSEAQQLLACSQNYNYANGTSNGFMGGIGSFCANSIANRYFMHINNYRIYEPGFCDSCLTVPAGKMFVFWVEHVGPNCSSSCAPGHPPAVP